MARRARNLAFARLRGGAVILVYHRIASSEVDPFRVCVSPGRFAEHLDVLRTTATVVPLSTLTRPGRLPPRCVALTFDDGYEDNLTAALPALERFEVPATVFAVTAYQGSEFWWDRLSRVPPSALVQYVQGSLEAAPGRRDPLRVVHAHLRALDEAARNEALLQLGGAGPASGPHGRSLSAAELKQLAESRLIEIGAHTHSHADLAALDAGRQRREIEENRERLEAVTGRRPSTFAYPFGRFANFTAETVGLLRELGFSAACTAEPGVVSGWTERFELPRLWVGDWTGDVFRERLLRWLR
jgi:peptidoglycan/xylan/chitin deacetylase (PgdA/CDA1 family)